MNVFPLQQTRIPGGRQGAAVIPGGCPRQGELLPDVGWPRATLTELPVPREDDDALTPLLATLAQLGGEGRWICLVAPPCMPDSAALHAAGIDPSHILLVHPKARQDGLGVVEESLRCGNCSAVLAWPLLEDEVVLRRLQRAAKAGDTRGVLFRPRGCGQGEKNAWQASPRH